MPTLSPDGVVTFEEHDILRLAAIVFPEVAIDATVTVELRARRYDGAPMPPVDLSGLRYAVRVGFGTKAGQSITVARPMKDALVKWVDTECRDVVSDESGRDAPIDSAPELARRLETALGVTIPADSIADVDLTPRSLRELNQFDRDCSISLGIVLRGIANAQTLAVAHEGARALSNLLRLEREIRDELHKQAQEDA